VGALVLAGRILLGLVFGAAGLSKLASIAATRAGLIEFGVPRALAGLALVGEVDAERLARRLQDQVDADARRDDSPRVNIRVPMQLLRAGVRLASLVPAQAQEKVNRALRARGFDILHMTPEKLEELVDHLEDVSVDVEDGKGNAKVRVFCE